MINIKKEKGYVLKFNTTFAISIIILLTISLTSFANHPKRYIPKDGFVPNDSTAIKIAVAVLLPIYGDEIYKYEPFKTELIEGKIWKVKGSRPDIKGWRGGTPMAEIRKSDGKIISVDHGK